MKLRGRVVSLLSVAAVLTGLSAGFGTASAAPAFGPGTGIHEVIYNQGGVTYDTYLNRSASGIVEQWVANVNWPAGNNGIGLYEVWKPTPQFKPTCDQLGVLYQASGWTYDPTQYKNPADLSKLISLAAYFPSTTQTYFTCAYALSNYAMGNFSWQAYSTTNRTTTFMVNVASPAKPMGGTFHYSDADGNAYDVVVDHVVIIGNTVWFSGPVSNATTAAWDSYWLLAKAIDNAGTVNPDQFWGSFVLSDPSATLGTVDPLDGPFAATSGDILVYTRAS